MSFPTGDVTVDCEGDHRGVQAMITLTHQPEAVVPSLSDKSRGPTPTSTRTPSPSAARSSTTSPRCRDAAAYLWYEQGTGSRLPVQGCFSGYMDISQVS
jgi:hypothetical protein